MVFQKNWNLVQFQILNLGGSARNSDHGSPILPIPDGRARSGCLCGYPDSAAVGRYLDPVLHHHAAIQPGLGEIGEAAVAPKQRVNLR